jgi:hypothetical protein
MEHGSCQVCGREKNLTKAGRIPKHKTHIRRNHNYHCPGGGELPGEQDLSVIRELAQENPKEYLYKLILSLKARMTVEERMEIEEAETALDDFLRALQEFMWFAHVALPKYAYCRVCGENVNEETFKHAYRRLEQPVCSPECLNIETFKRHGCCEKGKTIPCVCMHSWTCPEHGTFHIGTHD